MEINATKSTSDLSESVAMHSVGSINRLDELSTEIEDIISDKPPFIVRWGTVCLSFFLFLLALICWIVKYPDIVTAKARLTSINSPKEVVAKTSGKLVKLFVKEGESVKVGTTLGYMESIASPKDIFALSATLDSIIDIVKNDQMEKLPPFIDTSYQNLGELQQSYQIFLQSFLSFRAYIVDGFYLRKKILLANDLVYLRKQYQALLNQKELSIQDIELSQKTFEANESLKKDKVISELDYRVEKSKLISKKLTLPQINTSLLNNEAYQNEKQKEIAELENTISQQKNIFIQSINTMRSEVENWKRRYVLSAPIDGEVSFASFLQENQQMRENEVLCFINPFNTIYYAELNIPQKNFGKVFIGQKVLLKFPSYPFQEYGIVIGQVDLISNIPTDSGYLAKVSLPYVLETNHKKRVQFREGLQAEGDIVTKDIRLLQRFYYNITGQVKIY